MEWIADPSAWLGLGTLIVLELVLGIDNLVFIAILADKLPPGQRDGLREIKLFVIRPSQNLGALAFDLKRELPRTLGYLLDRFGAEQAASDDFLSTLMFQHTYIQRLLDLGEQDGIGQGDGLDEFLEPVAAAAD